MGKPIIWSGVNAKLINSGDLIDSNNLSLSDGGKITITQTGFGTTCTNYVGAPVYYTGSAWALADATLSANAEVLAYVYAVLSADSVRLIFNGQIATIGSSVLQGGGSLVAGTTYFLSTTSGQITATPTTVVGQINKPVGTAISTTTLELTNYRGNVVGSANARTQISLANNATTTVQDVSLYDAGSLSGWVLITNLTSANTLRFYVNAPFAKYGGTSNYYISPAYVGDTPPTGFSMTITAAGLIQITLPTVSGYASAVINFALNAPAVGTNFPLNLDSANLTNSGITGLTGTAATTAYTSGSGKVGETITATGSAQTLTTAQYNDGGVAVQTLQPGIWAVYAGGYFNPSSSSTVVNKNLVGIGTATGNSSSGMVIPYETTSGPGSTGGQPNMITAPPAIKVLTVASTFYVKVYSEFTVAGQTGLGYFKAIRIA